jgi:alpha-amylase
VPAICLCFEVHQPFRLRRKFDSSKADLFERYFDLELTRYFFDRIASKCYYPALNLLLGLVEDAKPFRIAFSPTGTWVEQARLWHPDLLELLRKFPRGSVEFVAETYYHSLSSLFVDKAEFVEQVREHELMLRKVFRHKAKVMTNTEMIYNNLIARTAARLGFNAIFTEGVPWILGWRSPNFVYKPPSWVDANIKVLLRNRRLTDDIGFRFCSRDWVQWPLTADKYAAWLAACEGQCINVFLDFETFGEHYWAETGIFDFLRALPFEVNKWESLDWALPRELAELEPVGEFDVFELSTISWADLEMDTSAWLGNDIQRFLFNELQELGKKLRKAGDEELLRVWRCLQTSDMLHHLCMKGASDHAVHAYFSYFHNPIQASATLSKVVLDFVREVEQRLRS